MKFIEPLLLVARCWQFREKYNIVPFLLGSELLGDWDNGDFTFESLTITQYLAHGRDLIHVK